MNGDQRGRPSFAEGRRERDQPGFGRAIRVSGTGAQTQNLLPIVPSVIPPVTAVPVGVSVISVSGRTPVVPRSVIPRPYGNDYAGSFSRFRAHERYREQCRYRY